MKEGKIIQMPQVSKLKILSLLFLFYFLFSICYVCSAPRIGILKDIKGEVLVQKKGAKNWVVAQEGMKVENGDKIKTRARSEVKISWDDANIMKLTSYTEFTINIATKDPQTGSEKTSTHLSIGKTLVNIKKAMAPNSSFEISTPSTLVGVRSTKFSVEVDSRGNTKVVTYEGIVKVTAEGETKEVREGKKSITEKGKPPQDEKPQDELDKMEVEEHQDIIGKEPSQEDKKAKEGPFTLQVENPASDMETEQDRITVSGTTSPDAKVLINGVGVNPNTFGKFDMEVQLNEGDNTITITATNPAGKTITITRKIKKLKKEKPKDIDTIAPTITILQPANNSIVTAQVVSIIGITEAGAKVETKGVSTIAGSDGSFTLNVSLADGLNVLTIKATDKAGNIGIASLNIKVDIIPCFLTVSEPPDDLTCTPAHPKCAGGITKIIGFTKSDAKVTIGGVPVYVDPSGSFTYLAKLQDGSNIFIIKAVCGKEEIQVAKKIRLIDLPPPPPEN